MNILFVSETLPGEIGYGGAQRTKLLFDALKKCGDVYCLYRNGPEESNIPRCKRIGLRERTDLLHYFNSIWWRVYKRILPVTPGWEMQYYPFPSRLPVGQLFPNVQFDIVVTRYYRQVGLLHLWRYGRLIVDVDDHPLQVYHTMIRPQYGRVRRLISDFLLRRICKLIEGKFNDGWVVSEDQKKWVRSEAYLGVLRNIPLCPSHSYLRSSARNLRLVTVGLMAHPPNIDGISWFLSNVWNKVRNRWPSMEYWLVGGGASDEVSRKWSSCPGVRVCGFVVDLESVYSTALASVVPIRSGGGSCIKTLESLAYSCSCLTTSFGARGIDSKYMRDSLHGLWEWNSCEDFIRQLESIVVGGEEIVQYECNGRRMIEELYSLSSFEESVSSVIENMS